MIRPEHRTVAWLSLVAIVACSPAEQPATESASAPVLQAAPPLPLPADASRPNRVLDPAGFTEPQTRKAYEAAKKYAHILERIYCYCRCQENIGHRALVEFFQTEHGANCHIRMMEAIMVARITQQGTTPLDI